MKRKSISIAIGLVLLLVICLIGINVWKHNNEIVLKRNTASELEIESNSTIVKMIEKMEDRDYYRKIIYLEEQFNKNKMLYTSNAKERIANMFSSFHKIRVAVKTWDDMSTKEKSVYLLEFDGVKVYLLVE